MISKYKEIAESLRRQIITGEYPPESMLPTEKQLCDTYKASRQTVRQALKCLVEDGLIARRQGSGSRVLSPRQEEVSPGKTVAIITSYIGEYIFPSILREAEAVLSAHNCTTLLYATGNQVSTERRILMNLLDMVRDGKVDGILVEGTKSALPNPNLDLYEVIQRENVPMVFYNGFYEQLQTVSVMDDNIVGGYLLTEYLLRKNHKKIAGIFKSDDIQGHQRYAGYAAALRNYDMPMEDRNILWYCTEDKGGMASNSSVWNTKVAPTLQGCSAVVCYNDELANCLVRCLLDHGISVPEQVAVVSFDNSSYSDLCPRPITSLSHGPYNVGQIAANTLMKIFEGKEVHSQKVPWFLEEKQSS